MRFLRRLGTIYPGRGSGALHLLHQAGAWRSGNWEQNKGVVPRASGPRLPKGKLWVFCLMEREPGGCRKYPPPFFVLLFFFFLEGKKVRFLEKENFFLFFFF